MTDASPIAAGEATLRRNVTCLLDGVRLDRGTVAWHLWVRKEPSLRTYACASHPLSDLADPFVRWVRQEVRERERARTASLWMDWEDGRPRFTWVEASDDPEVNAQVGELIAYVQASYDLRRARRETNSPR